LAQREDFKAGIAKIDENIKTLSGLLDAEGKLTASQAEVRAALEGTGLEKMVDGWFKSGKPAEKIRQVQEKLQQEKSLLTKPGLTAEEWPQFLKAVDERMPKLKSSTSEMTEKVNALKALGDEGLNRFVGRVIEDSEGAKPLDLHEML